MAGTARPSPSGAPLTVGEIVQQANTFEYNSQIPLRYWLRSADTIQKESRIYEREGNDQQTYLLLFRHAILVLEKLSQHPEAKQPQNKAALAAANKVVRSDLAAMEVLKPRIESRYAAYQEHLATRKTQDAALRKLEGGQEMGGLVDGMGRASLNSARSSTRVSFDHKTSLDAGDSQKIAALIAQSEIRRRDTARRAVRQAGVSEEEEQERRTGGVWDGWESGLGRPQSYKEEMDLSKDIIEAGRRRESVQNGHCQRPSSVLRPSSYHYPTIPNKSSQSWRSDEPQPQPGAPPRPPPKIPPIQPAAFMQPLPPSLPPKPPRDPYAYQSAPPPYESTLPPPIPGKYSEAPDTSFRAQSPALSEGPNALEYTFKPSAYLENGTPLRTVFVPSTLRSEFLRVAAVNTRNNIETCGILCGTLISNALFVSKLVIPEQKGTSDTCETLNESDLFDFCDKEDLMVLGWIHTHPSQTCFMSSRDCHTHCGYQVMMPESIAIVCAPSKDPSWGIFRITDPPGMKTLLNCGQSGLFHPHNVDNIYTDASKPGHVHELSGLDFQIVDQRP
ncbi:uncharacterized protein BDZ99DRAFT_485665 [Mytilinidion resinicola]|uniref:MPN domain-containing protein n=1 Tax=Mytilinidion resinicola TaxID=574789 RepID=A0A6A6Z4V8_9PEZI|nr:uncharacterized protein BDZ99DRAFT_485665 [Mytilinidion resinicola]KAF2815287.1 hypothetical protein BDZ99DRAFT_485665 [Mytilinidion resinicola]